MIKDALPCFPIPKKCHLRIVATRPEGKLRAKGQDAQVLVLAEDGGLIGRLDDCESVSFRIDGRQSYCRATFVCSGVEIEADATLDTTAMQIKEENASLRRRVVELTNQLAAEKLGR